MFNIPKIFKYDMEYLIFPFYPLFKAWYASHRVVSFRQETLLHIVSITSVVRHFVWKATQTTQGIDNSFITRPTEKIINVACEFFNYAKYKASKSCLKLFVKTYFGIDSSLMGIHILLYLFQYIFQYLFICHTTIITKRCQKNKMKEEMARRPKRNYRAYVN